MERIVACMILVLNSKKRRVSNGIKRRKRLRTRRASAFARRQSQERFIFTLLLSMAALTHHAPERSLWVKERSSHWWQHVVNCMFMPHDWLENFPMSHATFLYLCNELRSSVKKDDTVMRKAIPVEQRIALTLWFLSTNADNRTIGHLFGVSKATICVVTKQVCSAIVEILLPKYIQFPSGDGLTQVVDGFKHKLGFSQCAGAVDGTHIPIVSHMRARGN